MNSINVPYGTGQLQFDFPDHWRVNSYVPEIAVPLQQPEQAVDTALGSWFNSLEGKTALNGARSVAIAINDKTRPIANDILLPPLLRHLEQAGIAPEDIHLMIATGTHTQMHHDEFTQVVPAEILQRHPVESHDCSQIDCFVSLGRTRRGTPVKINQNYMQADLRVVVGNIEPHHFMGFSGGVKTAAIGLASRETIHANHSLMFQPGAGIGSFSANPIRQDLEEIGALIDIHLAVNAIMNAERDIVHVLTGAPLPVIQAGFPLSRAICQTPIRQRFDLVIASTGGHPKDINLYQAQKALSHASLITRDGGVVILTAACPEGSGSAGYDEFMQGVQTVEEVFEKTRQTGFVVGPHKAYQFARDLARIHVILISTMDPHRVQSMLLQPASSPAEALRLAQLLLDSDQPSVAILPKATQTIPIQSAA